MLIFCESSQHYCCTIDKKVFGQKYRDIWFCPHRPALPLQILKYHTGVLEPLKHNNIYSTFMMIVYKHVHDQSGDGLTVCPCLNCSADEWCLYLVMMRMSLTWRDTWPRRCSEWAQMACSWWCILGKSSGWASVGTHSTLSFPEKQGKVDRDKVRGGRVAALQPFTG